MANAFWTYPWDIADMGLAEVTGEIRDLGFDMISVAAAYHAGRFLQVRSPKRRAYFPQDGALYFRPDPALWADQVIQPIVSDLVQEQDVLRDLVAARQAGGLQVSAWTVCLHNTAQGERHPEHVTRNAWGDPNFYNLCPASEASQSYVETLVRDLSHNVRPDRIELESPNFLGFAHEHHHEKDMVGLPPEGDFLMSLCFCDHCRSYGEGQGVSVDEVQAQVRGLLDQMCSGAVPERVAPDFPSAGLDAFPEPLRSYLTLREDHVTKLLQRVQTACHTDVELLMIVGQAGWIGGANHRAITEMGIGLLLCSYDQSDAEAEALMHYAATLPAGRGGQIGLRLAVPEYADATAFQHRLALLRQHGATGVNLYNYGLVPQGRLAWLDGAFTPS